MDIGALSIGMNQAKVGNAVQLSVMKIAMNTAEETSGEAINMIDNMAVEPYKGEHIDITV